MDADILRLILFLAGIALILGIYFWDRYKRINRRIHAIRRVQQQKPRLAPKREKSTRRQEPQWAHSDSAASEGSDDDGGLDQALEQLDEIIQEERPRPRVAVTVEQTEFSFDAQGSESEVDEPVASGVPPKILQLNILARKGEFAGDQIMNAARDLGLESDEFLIFNRFDEGKVQDGPYFSMASMVEPGTFPLQDMSSFRTPGLTLFAQITDQVDGMTLFNEMLENTERLAALLDGEIQDETHSDLSKQTIEHIREEIQEHNRQLRLARISHRVTR